MAGRAWIWRVGVWFPALAAVSGWYLLGVSATVAAVVYPSFALVGAAQWPTFHAAHSQAIVRAVGPGWVVEGVATVGWLVQSLTTTPLARGLLALALAHAVAAGATVALTVAAAVPVHAGLSRSTDTGGSGGTPDPTSLRHLRVAHSVRTAAWVVAAVTATAGVGLALHR